MMTSSPRGLKIILSPKCKQSHVVGTTCQILEILEILERDDILERAVFVPKKPLATRVLPYGTTSKLAQSA